MKTKRRIITAIGILIGFVAGLVIGITLTNPGLSLMEAAGTIGKMDTYRNVRVTEQDIELRNELLADAALREAYKNYLLYEYTVNVKMADDIQFAILEASKKPEFWSVNSRIMGQMEDYAMFIDNARLMILEAIGTINELDGRSQIAIRTVLNNAGNALAQTTYRSMILFDFMESVDRYLEANGKEPYEKLALAHDRLFSTMLTNCLVNENRPVLKHLLERDLLTEDESLALNNEVLISQLLHDINLLPASKSLSSAAEQLQSEILAIDMFNSESFLSNSQHLSSFNEALHNILSSDFSRLGVVMSSTSHLGVAYDAELLNAFQAFNLSSVQNLSAAADMFNAQQLQLIIGASQELSSRQR